VGEWWGDSFKKLGLEDQNNYKDHQNPHRMLRGKNACESYQGNICNPGVGKECHSL